MTAHERGRHIEVVQDGQVVGTADVEPIGDATVRADLHVEAGHHAVGVGATLVDAVLDEAKGGARLEATLPSGDTESLERLRARCDDLETRPAGATCLVDATLPADSTQSADAGLPTDPGLSVGD
ncbi:MAG TPA: hypothetical protein VI357_16585 [Mycobacteriales bacterium]